MTKKITLLHIPADQLAPLPGNARRLADPQAIEKLAGQIEAHGFQNPINVWREPETGLYLIIAGNHRFEAGQRLGMVEFPAIEYTGTRAQALARSISDNKTSEWTEWDPQLLHDMLQQLPPEDFAATALNTDEIDRILSRAIVAEIQREICSEEEYQAARVTAEEIIAALAEKIRAIAEHYPVSLNTALAVIQHRGDGRQLLFICDPSAKDIVAEIRRHAEAGELSPLEKVFEVHGQ